MTDGGPGRSRRRFIAAVSSVAVVGVAGCLGDSDDEGEDDADPEPDIPEDQRELVEAWIDEVDDELNVQDWSMFGDQFIPRYVSGNPPQEDIPLLAESYAGVVDEGFEFETMPTVLHDDGTIDWMVYIYPSWAEEYLEGSMTEDEYHEAIEQTVH